MVGWDPVFAADKLLDVELSYLMVAAMESHLPIAELLLSHGADADCGAVVQIVSY